MMKWMKTAFLAMALVGVAACSKDENKPAKQDPAATRQAAPEPTYTDEELPVETDFEEEADREVTAENYKSELDTIEKEVGENQ